jgi:hypothetical protein
MKTLIKVTSSGLGTNLILNDTVRPELDYDFRTSNGREFYELTDVLSTGACICVAYTRHLPKTVNELDMYYSEDSHIAVFYTVWSYTKGSGREIVFKVVEHIKETKPHIKRFITLSPKTEMARKFHLSNGAIILSENEESVNYEYLV